MSFSEVLLRPQSLTEVSDRFAIDLTPQRLVELERLREASRENALGSQLYNFSQNGLKVQLWHRLGGASVDFLPEGHISAPDDKRQRDRFALGFLHGAENFLLLVEAGLLEDPGSFSGLTNTQMAAFLERHYGCSQTKVDDSVRIHADYATIREHVFSEDTGVAKARLIERLRTSEH